MIISTENNYRKDLKKMNDVQLQTELERAEFALKSIKEEMRARL